MQPRVIPSLPPNETGLARGATTATVLIDPPATAGALALVRLHCHQGSEPPLRRHHREDLVYHVLDGALAFRIGGATHHLEAGATILVPRGHEHGYALRSPTAVLLALLTPAGAEGCLGDLHAGTPIERLVIAAAHHGIDITGPPLDLT